MAEFETPPEPQRTLITTRIEYLGALERVIGMVKRELRIFDPDLSELDFNARSRIEALRRILSGGRVHRVQIALHDVAHVSTRCPRLIDLIRMFPSGLVISRTEGEAARIQDRFVLADENHFVRRPVATQARGVVVLDDPQEAHGMRLRFEEIWESRDRKEPHGPSLPHHRTYGSRTRRFDELNSYRGARLGSPSCVKSALAAPAPVPGSSTVAMDHAPTCWCSMLRAPITPRLRSSR